MRLDEEKVSKKRKRGKKSGMILKIILPIVLLVAMVTIAFSFFNPQKDSESSSGIVGNLVAFVTGSKNGLKNSNDSSASSININEGDIVYNQALETRFYKTISVSDGMISVGTVLREQNTKYQLIVTRFDENGNLTWKYEFGNDGDEWGYDIIEEEDGYVVLGIAASPSLNVRGRYDALVLKLTKDGKFVWYKTYGGPDWDRAYKIVKVKGGYAFVGDNYMKGGDVSENYGEHDFWIVKIDNNGNILWDKSFGGIRWDRAYSIGYIEESDTIIIVGSSNSFTDGTRYEGYVVAYSGNGELVWKTQLVNGQAVWPFDLKVDGKDIFVGGYTTERSGNGNSYVEKAFVAKLNDMGGVQYLKTFGANVRLQSISVLNSDDEEDRLIFAGYKDVIGTKQPWYGDFVLNDRTSNPVVVERSINSEYGMLFDATLSGNAALYSGMSMKNGIYEGIVKIMLE